MRFYRDRVVFTRGKGTGATDPDTGIYTPGEGETVVLTAPCNVQAGGLMAATRRESGNPDLRHDGELSVPREYASAILNVEPNDVAHIAYEPKRHRDMVQHWGADARAVFVRPEDRTVLLEYA